MRNKLNRFKPQVKKVNVFLMPSFGKYYHKKGGDGVGLKHAIDGGRSVTFRKNNSGEIMISPSTYFIRR